MKANRKGFVVERLNCRRCVNKEERCLMQLLWEKY